ncbi:MAG TPA: methyltransferase domain-containing protein [Patescibacteria group bacterium]|nr:methyltransferase domain-containing protein [Patescibacteria group bacterium]
MSAAYDTFDYPGYWIGRDYEHKSDIIALKAFLDRIKKIKNILDVGAGFGRLVPFYAFRAKKILLTDPSGRALKMARVAYHDRKNVKFIHSALFNLPTKIRSSSNDLVVMVRVIHHITNIDTAFKTINRLLSPKGYLVFEFANKKHVKATFKELFKGNYLYSQDLTTRDIRSKKAIKRGTLPFLNYHPDRIKEVLDLYGFDVIEKRSVSNIRSTFLKGIFSTDILLSFETILQRPFSYIDFGPSIFILARKRG